MSFASPLLLLVLLVVPAVLVFAVWVDRRSARYPVAFTNLELLAAVAGGSPRRWSRWIPVAFLLLALVAASIATARPRASIVRVAHQGTVVLLVDVSGSMAARDVTPTRLVAAQIALDRFLARVPPHIRLALVCFSSLPAVLVPPTVDRSLLRQQIDMLSTEGGTAIGDALAAAVRLATSSIRRGSREPGNSPLAIILLSDGAQTSGTLTPLAGATLAAHAGIPVYTIALGTNQGTLGIPGFADTGVKQLVLEPPDALTLATIADTTQGRTYRVRTASRLMRVYQELGSSIVRRHTTRELSSWFSGAGVLLILTSLTFARLRATRLP